MFLKKIRRSFSNDASHAIRVQQAYHFRKKKMIECFTFYESCQSKTCIRA